MVPGGESNDSALALNVRQLGKPVAGAAELERAAGLQAFALEPDLLPPDLAFDQRGPLDEPADSLRGGDDIGAPDLSLFD